MRICPRPHLSPGRKGVTEAPKSRVSFKEVTSEHLPRLLGTLASLRGLKTQPPPSTDESHLSPPHSQLPAGPHRAWAPGHQNGSGNLPELPRVSVPLAFADAVPSAQETLPALLLAFRGQSGPPLLGSASPSRQVARGPRLEPRSSEAPGGRGVAPFWFWWLFC